MYVVIFDSVILKDLLLLVFLQGLNLLLSCLKDSSEHVLLVTSHIFLPSFSMWAWELGKFPEEFLQLFVDQLDKILQVN